MVIIKWVRMKQVVWHAMLPRWRSGRWKLATCTFLSMKKRTLLGVFFYSERRGCYSCEFGSFSRWFFFLFSVCFKCCSFCGKSHHTPFATLPPPLKCVAMLSCVTYCILLQRSSVIYRWGTRRVSTLYYLVLLFKLLGYIFFFEWMLLS